MQHLMGLPLLHVRAQHHRSPFIGAGWSSPVARQAHNLKVVGSNPTPATNTTCEAPFGALSSFWAMISGPGPAPDTVALGGAAIAFLLPDTPHNRSDFDKLI